MVKEHKLRIKKPWLAALLNLFPGLGYLYNGKRLIFGGVWFFFTIAVLLESIYLVSMQKLPPESGNVTLSTIYGIILLFVFVYDAYTEAKEINLTK